MVLHSGQLELSRHLEQLEPQVLGLVQLVLVARLDRLAPVHPYLGLQEPGYLAALD